MVKFIWSGEVKQMMEGFMWIYVGYQMSPHVYRRTYKTASRQTAWDGSVGLLDGYDAP